LTRLEHLRIFQINPEEAMPKPVMRDIVILLPGIMGSVLQKDGRDVWALSGQAVWGALTNLSDTLRSLELNDKNPDPAPDKLEAMLAANPKALDDLGDGIRATRLLQDVHLIPGLWKIDGYTNTKNLILQEFQITEGTFEDSKPANFFEFPYDWRRDIRISAYRLKHLIDQKLKIWREKTGADDAKVILVAHSLGGLVSRYYLEVLEGWVDCKMLVTFGTPYRGSLNALNFVSNGFKASFLDFTKIVRSCTGVYQLLPTFEALEVVGSNGFHRVDRQTVPNLDRARATAAMDFHAEITTKALEHQQNEDYRKKFKIVPIVGIHQPTLQTAILDGKSLSVRDTMSRAELEPFASGDGTVPQISAVPEELFNDLKSSQIFHAESHASLQANTAALLQLKQELIRSQGLGIEIRGGLEAKAQGSISLDVDDLYLPEEPIHLRGKIICEQPAAARLTAELTSSNGRQSITFSGDLEGWQTATIDHLPAGLYRIEVSADPGWFDKVHDVFEVAG
jgi:pimeloyl-ACP methyl ester carboxylesterase